MDEWSPPQSVQYSQTPPPQVNGHFNTVNSYWLLQCGVPNQCCRFVIFERSENASQLKGSEVIWEKRWCDYHIDDFEPKLGAWGLSICLIYQLVGWSTIVWFFGGVAVFLKSIFEITAHGMRLDCTNCLEDICKNLQNLCDFLFY